MYSVQNVLRKIQNNQTKLQFMRLLKRRNVLDFSVGLVYRHHKLQIIAIY